MTRRFFDAVSGTVGTGGLPASGTGSTTLPLTAALTSKGSNVVLASGDTMLLSFFDGAGNLTEIMEVQGPVAAGATSVTVSRGQQGTTAAAQAAGTMFKHAIVASDHSFVSARVRASSDQSISGGTFTEINWDSVDYDTASLHASGTPARLYAPIAGFYRVSATVGMSSNPSRFIARLYKNGMSSGLQIPGGGVEVAGGTSPSMSVSTELALAAGDYVSIFVYLGGGSSVDHTIGAMTLTRIGG